MAHEEPQTSYVSGSIVPLQLDDGRCANATVLGTFEPFTYSCAIIVQLDDPELAGTFVLKLYDRRFAMELREEWNAAPWNSELESDYQNFAGEGSAAKFFAFCTDKAREESSWMYDYCEKWNACEIEAYLQYMCRKLYQTEMAAYVKLHDLQGFHVPKVYAQPMRKLSSGISEADKYINCPGALLEYINGFPLTDLGDKAPRQYWQSICEAAIHVVHQAGDRGVCNRDFNTRNFIVDQDPPDDKYRVFMMDFGIASFRDEARSGDEFRSWQANEDEEGAVGCVMQMYLEGGFKYTLSSRAEQLSDNFTGEDGPRIVIPD